MKSLAELNKEVSEIQLQIRKLLLNNYSFDDGIADKLTVISTVSILHDRITIIQKEIRLRFPDAL